MPRREVLTPTERAQLFAFPADESALMLIRLGTLSRSDMTFIRHHRGAHNRLGIAGQMTYLRYPSRVLAEKEAPHAPLLGIVAAQLDVAPAAWSFYASRDETRREHLQELLDRSGLRQFAKVDYRNLTDWLTPLALQTTQGMVLAQALAEELRVRHVLLPPVPVIEHLCPTALTRAERVTFERLTKPLTPAHRKALDSVLAVREGSATSTLAWLRQPPGNPSANTVLAHLARLRAVRELNLPVELGRDVHQNRLLRLAREGAQTAVYQIQEYETSRRYATLVAILLDTLATLTDETLELHDRLIGVFFNRARNKHEREFAADGRAVNDKVRLYAKVGKALIASKAEKTDPFAAIEAILPWEAFTESVEHAEQLSRDEAFDALELLTDYFSTLRKYAPSFLEMFEFQGAPVAQSLLKALEVLRTMNRTGARKVPLDAPMAFVPPRWSRSVGAGENIDRRFYEFCALSELKNRLRAGDLYVPGSRQFRDFEEYLLPRSVFQSMHSEGRLGISVPTTAKAYIADRLQMLRSALDDTNRLAAADELVDARLNEKGLKIAPIEDDTPPDAKRLKAQMYGMLPRVKITDLLLEVDRWTGFTRHFTHLKSRAPAADQALLLTAILADAFNLGLEKMAEACPGTSLAKLAWLMAWHIRDESYAKSQTELVNAHHQLPFAAYWGQGTTSSSDGQRFRAGGHGESAGHQNAKYGGEPGVLFYTHISDQYVPFYTKVINANVRDATHVLDGLLNHESQLRIEEHYTDTAGFTDHVFALFHPLGFEFAPRISDLADKRIYIPGKAGDWPTLTPLVGGPLNLKLMEQQFDEFLRLVASIKQGTVTASLILRKLASYPRQNSLALAVREFGRLERTLFMLRYIRDPGIRHRISAGLAKGESRNSLARAIFFHRLGEIRDRSYENQRYRASGLNLVVAAITMWNTVYLERVVTALREHGQLNETLLPHVSPLGWNHIGLTGDYSWHANKRVAKGGFRPLRRTKPVESGGLEP
jgi:TnpA family transposase